MPLSLRTILSIPSRDLSHNIIQEDIKELGYMLLNEKVRGDTSDFFALVIIPIVFQYVIKWQNYVILRYSAG